MAMRVQWWDIYYTATQHLHTIQSTHVLHWRCLLVIYDLRKIPGKSHSYTRTLKKIDSYIVKTTWVYTSLKICESAWQIIHVHQQTYNLVLHLLYVKHNGVHTYFLSTPQPQDASQQKNTKMFCWSWRYAHIVIRMIYLCIPHDNITITTPQHT